jgi:hypothetical protein
MPRLIFHYKEIKPYDQNRIAVGCVHRRLVRASGMDFAEIRCFHLTEKILSGDRKEGRKETD